MRLLTFPACASGRGAGVGRAAAGPGLRRDPSGLPGSRGARARRPRKGTHARSQPGPPKGSGRARRLLCPGASLGLGRQQGDEDGASAPAALAPSAEPSQLSPGPGSLCPWRLPTLPQSLSWLCPPARALCSQFAPAHLCRADALSLTILS